MRYRPWREAYMVSCNNDNMTGLELVQLPPPGNMNKSYCNGSGCLTLFNTAVPIKKHIREYSIELMT